jgi:hypothetical protein
MGNIDNYKKRFGVLMESKIGNVKPLIVEESDIEEIMKMSKENQSTFDKLKTLFGVSPTYMKTKAKNLKYIFYDYQGSDDDILTVFDLDLRGINLKYVKNYIKSRVNRASTFAPPGLNLEYTISIFINEIGNVIFRFTPSTNNQYDDNIKLKKSYTKEFDDVDEMFNFIIDNRLPEMLSKNKYRKDMEEYRKDLYYHLSNRD